jgi:hypothetical protein
MSWNYFRRERPPRLATVSKALEMTGRTGSRLMDPELYRLKGELLLLSPGPGPEPDAEVAFRHAIEIARRQNTKSWELRASASLTRLLSRQGKRNEARQLSRLSLAGLLKVSTRAT